MYTAHYRSKASQILTEFWTGGCLVNIHDKTCKNHAYFVKVYLVAELLKMEKYNTIKSHSITYLARCPCLFRTFEINTCVLGEILTLLTRCAVEREWTIFFTLAGSDKLIRACLLLCDFDIDI